MCHWTKKSKNWLADDENVVCLVVKLILPCNSDLLANWVVIKYKFLMTTSIRETKSRFFPGSYINMYHDVLIR